MPDYNIIVNIPSGGGGKTSETIPTMPMSGTPAAKSIPTPTQETVNAITQGAGRRAQEQIMQYALAPINTATGGLATPVYGVIRAGLTLGASAALGSAAIGLAVWAVNKGIQEIKKRVDKLETETRAANNKDNLLLLAGSQTSAIEYKSGFFKGIYKTNRS